MLSQLTSYIRNRWHPLWRLRQLPAYRWFQQQFDRTVFRRIPETDLQVAIKLLRDASLNASPGSLEVEIRHAFTLVLGLAKPAVFWDIGANIGFYSWFVRRHPDVRQIVMFEPDPTNFGLITQTLRKNAISDCQALNVALADVAGESTFLVDRASGATGSLESISHRENTHSLHHAYQMNETITCRTATVDGLIQDGLPAPHLMKIDVEGAEHLVLTGAKSCLLQQRPVLIMETANLGLVRQLGADGYTVFRLDEGNFLFMPSGFDLTPLRAVFPLYENP